MKKIVSLVLALVLVMALATTAFAAGELNETTTSNTGNVMAQYVDASNEAAEVISVDVTWGAMTFTYTKSGDYVWVPGDHSINGDGISYAWTPNGNTVTVTNHSNVDVEVEFAFAALDAYNAITGSFTYEGETTLDAGVEGAYAAADKVVATLALTGALADTVTTSTQIGTVTVTLK